MRCTVKGSILTKDEIILTEIEFEGTFARIMVLTFVTPTAAQDYKNNQILKHLLPFYEESRIEGFRVHLRRLPVVE